MKNLNIVQGNKIGHFRIQSLELDFLFYFPNLRVCARFYDEKGGAIFSKNRIFGTTHGDAWDPRLRSPSLIMAPVVIESAVFHEDEVSSLNKLEGVLAQRHSFMKATYRRKY